MVLAEVVDRGRWLISGEGGGIVGGFGHWCWSGIEKREVAW